MLQVYKRIDLISLDDDVVSYDFFEHEGDVCLEVTVEGNWVTLS